MPRFALGARRRSRTPQAGDPQAGDPQAPVAARPAGGRGPQHRTLRRRLVAVLLGLLIGVAGAMGVVSSLALRGSLVAQLDDRLFASSERAAAAERGFGPVPDDHTDDLAAAPDGPPPALDAPGQGTGTVTLSVQGDAVRSGYIDDNGAFQALTDEQESLLEAVSPSDVPRTVHLAELGEYRVLATTTADGGLLVTGLSTADATATVQDYLVVEALVAAAGIVIAALAGTALVRRELEPLERVAATATRVSELPLDRGEVSLTRVPEADTDPGTEVGQVGAALNRMLGHIEAALTARHESETQVRQFVADASHELRTPLASIRGYAELVRRLPAGLPDDALRAMERVESEAERMTSLVEDLLLLARLDAGRTLDRVEVDLTALAIDAVADAHVAGPDHVWRLDLPPDGDPTDGPHPTDGADGEDADLDETGAAPCVVAGDEHRLRQVLANLLSNARAHTPPGTTVVTSVRCDGETVTVQVQDDGPGIPDTLRGRLFQRFTRGEEGRSRGAGSTGLGLAIVDAVVAAHGGRIEVDGQAGATTFTVTLPVAPAG
ncbi:cell wall metabolism sensor histidine kinase WalK [Cellulomonas sp. KRMCY2]|uniref:sensor histidine kinase n=1 Tax=Cellulomonas sp. KRMCY2 TaxID=1304865 RepID=UPI00045E9587|nr:HAMP domain-containing sensor histidine kinase [Cellulomonas sp. KRMCY2]